MHAHVCLTWQNDFAARLALGILASGLALDGAGSTRAIGRALAGFEENIVGGVH